MHDPAGCRPKVAALAGREVPVAISPSYGASRPAPVRSESWPFGGRPDMHDPWIGPVLPQTLWADRRPAGRAVSLEMPAAGQSRFTVLPPVPTARYPVRSHLNREVGRVGETSPVGQCGETLIAMLRVVGGAAFLRSGSTHRVLSPQREMPDRPHARPT
jgi:hypothetical protein